MTSANGNICRVIDTLWGESTDHQWIPHTKASEVEILCFLWCAPEETAEQTVQILVIRDALALIPTSL